VGRITIAGSHGQIALLLSRLLTDRGDHVSGIIRDPAQALDVEDHGAHPLVLDLEQATVEQLATAIADSDAVVFAAGAGPGSGAARKQTVDFGAAVALATAAREAGVARYVMVSAMGTDDPPPHDDVFSVYLRAKAEADRALAISDLDWTIVRPGRLTNDDPTGGVRVGRHVPHGEIPRADVAAVLAACLADDHAIHRVFEVVSGDRPIERAVADLDIATRTRLGR